MKTPKTVMVLMGGWSRERGVSLTSGQAVCDALQQKNYTVIPFDPPHDLDLIAKEIKKQKPDVIFNALHGVGGEDGTIQTVLDASGIPYTHSGVTASALAMNKQQTKAIVAQAGIPIVQDKTVTKDELQQGHPLPLPYVLKPIADGSSVGIYIIHNDDDLSTALPQIDDKALMAEPFISGRELTVTVLDLNDQEPQALCVTELKPKSGFYDYKAKYTDGMTDHILEPTLPDGIEEKLLKFAVTAHTSLKCSMLSRSDFRYNETDGIIFLETNTQPGMTSLSLVPEQAQHCGISFSDLVEQFILFIFNKKEETTTQEDISYG